MALPEDLVHVVVRQSLGTSGREEAQWGFYLHFDTVGLAPMGEWAHMTQYCADHIAPKIDDYWADISGMFPSDVRMRSVKVTHLDTSGHALDVATATIGSQDPGEAGSNSLPYEVACAVTLYGYDPGMYVANSRRRRGRFYLPPLAVSSLTTGGLFSATTVNSLSVATDAFLEDVQGMHVNEDTGPGDPTVIANLVTVSRVGAGAFHQVEASGIGNVPDSQRRRRNGNPEARTYAVLSHA